MSTEQWKPIDGWEDYAISSIGRVKRLTKGSGTSAGYIFTPTKNWGQYPAVILSKNRAIKHISIHRLVAITFIGNPPSPKHECNHINGDRTDNHVENLEWVTRSQNCVHAIKLGTMKMPDGIKITEAIAQEILDAPKGYGTGARLARKFGLTISHISLIRTRKCWKRLIPKPGVRPAPVRHQPH